MALSKADLAAIAQMIAAASQTAAPVKPVKAATKAPAEPEPDGDVGGVTVMALDATGRNFARISANRYKGAVRVGVAKGYSMDTGDSHVTMDGDTVTIGHYQAARYVAYFGTRAQVNAAIAALREAAKHLPE